MIKKNKLTIIVLILVIGFAAVSTSLLIKGSTKIGFKENDFDVYFSNVYLNDVLHNEFISSDGKNITFETAKLINVGEEAILRYEIKNSSTQYDATINLNYNESLIDNKYVSIESTKDFDDIIEANSQSTGTIKITLDRSVVEDKDLDFSIAIDANATGSNIESIPDNIINNGKPGDYSVSFEVKDKEDKPLKNKPVVIISGNDVFYGETDLDGNIYFDNIHEGTQDVYIFDDGTLDDVKNMTVDEIKQNASDKITITTSTSTGAKGDKYDIDNIFIDKTENLDLITIKIGHEVITKKIDDDGKIEFNVDSNEQQIEISGLGIKEINPGENTFELTLDTGEVITIIINNVRPTPPILTGGNEVYINKQSATIALEKEGTSLSDVDYYEYYISESAITSFNNLVPTGTTEATLDITDEGTRFIYYRTVSKNDTRSEWSNPVFVKLDYSKPTLEITSIKTYSNKININYNASDKYSGIKNLTCKLGDKEGLINNGVCSFDKLESNKQYNYKICAEDHAGNEETCKEGNVITNEIKNPFITFDSIPSLSGEYFLGQTAKVSFDSTDIEIPSYYIKSTRYGTSNINITKSCGTNDSPSECIDITPTKRVEANMWYQVDGNINISYNEASDEYSKIIAVVYDGNNYSNKTTGTIGKIAFAAADLEYTNPLAPNVTNVQEAIDDLYKRLR